MLITGVGVMSSNANEQREQAHGLQGQSRKDYRLKMLEEVLATEGGQLLLWRAVENLRSRGVENPRLECLSEMFHADYLGGMGETGRAN